METEFKGTPGAWFATYDHGYSTWIIDVIDDKEQLVACAIPDSKIESEANARLIAAAPEMLEALQNLVFLHSCEQEGIDSAMPTRGQWMDAISKAEKAINKALGR
ncbi:hypothetical protein [Alistipes ihumii]|jgi:hypothetical protein|uniref:hypothetical protein n=1 Tax=Alistipes ihumii TaxID=1470347 RepID=UPI002658F3A4|nr:hypothetical protein [Alistipes ihumii]